jgi:hypothetical protein
MVLPAGFCHKKILRSFYSLRMTAVAHVILSAAKDISCVVRCSQKNGRPPTGRKPSAVKGSGDRKERYGLSVLVVENVTIISSVLAMRLDSAPK